MNKSYKRFVAILFTRIQALRHGLLICQCGHPENNHFNWNKKPCGQCKCEELQEHPVGGVDVTDYVRRYEKMLAYVRAGDVSSLFPMDKWEGLRANQRSEAEMRKDLEEHLDSLPEMDPLPEAK